MKIKDPVFIGKPLRRLRDEAGLTQDELAYRSRMDRSFLSELERNIKSPSLFTMYRLAIGLDMEYGELANEIAKEIQFEEIFKKIALLFMIF